MSVYREVTLRISMDLNVLVEVRQVISCNVFLTHKTTELKEILTHFWQTEAYSSCY